MCATLGPTRKARVRHGELWWFHHTVPCYYEREGLVPALIWNCPSEIAISRVSLINDIYYTGVTIDDPRN